MTVRDRLTGLAALIALVAVVPGTPALLFAVDALPDTSDFTWTRLTNPDDGTLAVAVITVVAWLAWFVFTGSVIVDIASRARGVRAPSIPGLWLPQLTAGRLVALASLLFVATPIVAQTANTSRAAADIPHPPPTPTVVTQTREPAPTPEPSAPSADRRDPGPRAIPVTYTVKRGDSLWKIAESHLGSGRRFGEIVELNEAVLRGEPDFIMPGTVLNLPPAHQREGGEDVETYVVRPGDTLSDIAEDHLGDSDLYPRIYHASREIDQPDNAQLTSPDLIHPGWKLRIPLAGPGDDFHPSPRPDEQRTTDPIDPPTPITPGEQSETPEPAPVPTDEFESTDVVTAGDAEGAEETSTPSWVLPGLTGGGALLAGALLLVLRQHRRTQMRFRRPGQVIAPPPPELRPVEKTAQFSGSATAPKVDVLDRALRDLAARSSRLPTVHHIALSTSGITLHLRDPADLPTPWTGGPEIWIASIDADFCEQPDQMAPYPLLVSIGQADDGDLVLVDLEMLRSIAVVGDHDRAGDLGRHIAAELALNPWAELVDIDILGIGHELARIAPVRLHHHAKADTAFLDRFAARLEAQSPSQDPDRYGAVIAAGTLGGDDDKVCRVANIITNCAGRSTGAIVTILGEPPPDAALFDLSRSNRLVVDQLELSITPAGLTPEEAQACSTIVDLTREPKMIQMPVSGAGTGDDAQVTDAGGALRPDVTQCRDDRPAGTGSLLPLASTTYAGTTSTTTDDVDRLAPVVDEATRSKVLELDPTLDDDLRFWFDPDCPLPRLSLLGPVGARTCGDARAVIKRKPYYVEMLAFLVLHPAGTTSGELAEAFSITTSRARVDLHTVRVWLGVNPRTQTDHLPSAKLSRAARERGLPAYQVDDVLSDVGLFRRLRARGQARGADGMDDLISALRLVTGEPFSHLRPAGWNWLLDGDRVDHVMTCAVVDVSHLVATRTLSEGDLELARWAAETGHHAAPSDDTCILDLVQVAAASGHADLAQQQLVRDVLDRADNNYGPIELPERTASILRTRGSNQRRS